MRMFRKSVMVGAFVLPLLLLASSIGLADQYCPLSYVGQWMNLYYYNCNDCTTSVPGYLVSDSSSHALGASCASCNSPIVRCIPLAGGVSICLVDIPTWKMQRRHQARLRDYVPAWNQIGTTNYGRQLPDSDENLDPEKGTFHPGNNVTLTADIVVKATPKDAKPRYFRVLTVVYPPDPSDPSTTTTRNIGLEIHPSHVPASGVIPAHFATGSGEPGQDEELLLHKLVNDNDNTTLYYVISYGPMLKP